MGFWTEQDVLQALKEFKIPYAKVYGQINQDLITGKLYFDGVRSTGCIFCCFGLQMETTPNRFQMLKKTHPKQHQFCMEKLGLGKVLNYIHEHCPDRKIARRFGYGEYINEQQLEMFG
ncbi:MAG: hypothetical protein GY710_26845 [Desulfobacteraceae bacterium]|nr:hypothetical protein [Desulfobacteraceae bacterium]